MMDKYQTLIQTLKTATANLKKAKADLDEAHQEYNLIRKNPLDRIRKDEHASDQTNRQRATDSDHETERTPVNHIAPCNNL